MDKHMRTRTLLWLPQAVVAFVLLQLVIAAPARSQIDTTFNRRSIQFADYLKMVADHNLEYAAEKYSINIAEAGIAAAKIFPDPYMALDWTENSEQRTRTGHDLAIELGTTIEVGGKRKARIRLAEGEKQLAEKSLASYFQELRATAAAIYLEAVMQQHLFRIKRDSYHAMLQLAESIRIRHDLGSNSEMDNLQGQLEAGVLLNEVLQAEAEWKNSLAALTHMTGTSTLDTLYLPSEPMQKIQRDFEVQDLVQIAWANRQDLQEAGQRMRVAELALRLAQKERFLDLDIRGGVGREYALPGNQETARNVTAGVSIPLKVSNVYNGNVQKARWEILQADKLVQDMRRRIKMEVVQSFRLYQASLKQVESFENGLLEKGKTVLNGKSYSYKRGETSLLEVLNAQRTFNDIQISYYESLEACIASLIELEKAAGIWDLSF
jgi:outer membrane protein, heavy metal efflux system